MNYAALVSAVSSYTENTFPTVDMNVFITQAEQRIFNSMQFAVAQKIATLTLVSGSPFLNCPNDFLSAQSLAVIGSTGVYTFLLNKDSNFIREAYPTVAATETPKYYAIFGPQVSGVTPTTELRFILGPTPSAALSAELNYFYYPESIVQRPILTLGAITAGTSYATGTYSNVSLTGGSGSGATASIVVSGGGVTSVTVVNGGTGFVVGDTMSALAANIGGTGSGFSIPVATVGNTTGTTWLGDNFDTVLLYGTLMEAYTYMKGETDIIALYDGTYKEALTLAKRLIDGLDRQDVYRSGQTRVPVT